MGMKKRLLWLLLAGAAVLVYVGLQTGVIYGSVMAAAVAAGDKVALVRYTGHGNLADHLEEITAMVRSHEERSGL